MEDDGGQMLVSSVDPEIRESMRRVVNYLEKAYNIKPQKVNFSQFKKTLPLWFACMTTEPDKDFSYELTNRTGRVNLVWEYLKWITFTSDHTIVALVTATFERFNVRHSSGYHNKLKQECRRLQQEFKVIINPDHIEINFELAATWRFVAP